MQTMSNKNVQFNRAITRQEIEVKAFDEGQEQVAKEPESGGLKHTKIKAQTVGIAEVPKEQTDMRILGNQLLRRPI